MNRTYGSTAIRQHQNTHNVNSFDGSNSGGANGGLTGTIGDEVFEFQRSQKVSLSNQILEEEEEFKDINLEGQSQINGTPNKIKKDKIVVTGKAHKHIKKDKKRGQSKEAKINQSLSVNNIMSQNKEQPFGPASILKTFLKGDAHAQNPEIVLQGQSFENQTMGNAYQCRICLERITNIFTTSDVTSPCKCAGSVKFIHVQCLKQPDTDNYDDEDDEGMDLLDRNLDSFKFFFILLSLAGLFFFISSFLVTNPILTNILLDDPLYLIFRIVIFIVFLVSAAFGIKWRKMLASNDKQANGMNMSLQEQIIQVQSGRILNLIEKSRGRGQELLEKLQQNKEEETSSRQLIGSSDFSSRIQPDLSHQTSSSQNFHL
ncbi:zinc finger protein [Stylonychia lemnae]|uniref:Zinc finger protein n=1 Tax=Stylonychia lemnae TaxID=5949 RepID=A0A077ZMG0_STYLE|nr:zinc finger protein [Stylonychia lemnae]|eukprot:CDW71157.1 zinc finger protein [Stylonychia lemnae]